MNGLTDFTFESNCGRCGKELEHIQTRTITARERRAFLHCKNCNCHWAVVVQMVAIVPDRGGCGTAQGWKNHKLNGTQPCPACETAYLSMYASRQRPSKDSHSDKCGTNAGWMQHDHDGTPPCDLCRIARNAYKQRAKAKKKESVG